MTSENKIILFDFHSIPLNVFQQKANTDSKIPNDCLKKFSFQGYYKNQPLDMYSYYNKFGIQEFEQIFASETVSSKVLNENEIRQLLIPSFH
jgi:hypothetical protein